MDFLDEIDKNMIVNVLKGPSKEDTLKIFVEGLRLKPPSILTAPLVHLIFADIASHPLIIVYDLLKYN